MKELECVNCGGQLEADHANHRLVCPYCDSVFVLEQDQQPKETPIPEPSSTKVNSASGCVGCLALLIFGFVIFNFIRLLFVFFF